MIIAPSWDALYKAIANFDERLTKLEAIVSPYQFDPETGKSALPLITATAIKKVVGAHFPGVNFTGRTQERYAVRARQIAAYLMRKLTPLSFPQIGLQLGGHHHTTIIFGIERIQKLIETDAKLRDLVAQIEADITTPAAPQSEGKSQSGRDK